MSALRHLRKLVARLVGRGPQPAGDPDVQIELSCDEGPRIALGGPLRLPTGRVFPELFVIPHSGTVIGIDRAGGALVKVEVTRNPRKHRDLAGESEVMQALSDRHCASCPTVLEVGQLDAAGVGGSFASLGIGEVPRDALRYLVQQYFPPGGRVRLADIILSLLEQKALGVYQGDVKPAHLRVRADGVCVFIDYDQARALDDRTRRLNCADFLHWSDEFERQKNGTASWRTYFAKTAVVEIDPLLEDGALTLAATTVYRNQRSTNNSVNTYHSIRERDVMVRGTRTLDDRRHILDRISFAQDERVLDLGCNAGLLCQYLHDRGCAVTGMDMDPAVIAAAGMIARITGRSIAFVRGDIDADELRARYDTVMLFSVLHHANDIGKTARKIAQACDRVIIEARPTESGKKPVKGQWVRSSGWQYDNLSQLTSFLRGLFVGFDVVTDHGMGGKGRHILEFRRGSLGQAPLSNSGPRRSSFSRISSVLKMRVDPSSCQSTLVQAE